MSVERFKQLVDGIVQKRKEMSEAGEYNPHKWGNYLGQLQGMRSAALVAGGYECEEYVYVGGVIDEIMREL